MYRLDWVEQLKLRTAPPSRLRAGSPTSRTHPTVWQLGFTSMLTDISSEMVTSVLPAFIVLHLHMSPLQYGAIDGIYNGIAISILALASGLLADRLNRQKEVALAGYGIAALSKLLLFAASGIWGWIMAAVAADRIGKGIRTAPRDALISLYSARESLAGAFAVHRSLDACGALLGPLVAVVVVAYLPGAYEPVWITSFVFALLGFAVLWLFVRNPPLPKVSAAPTPSLPAAVRLLSASRLRRLGLVGVLLSATTVGDGFLYLLLQQRGGIATGFFPLFYVVTASFYMLFSIPVGRVADRWGRSVVFLSGYAMVALIYGLLLSSSSVGLAVRVLCLALFGLYYAATEGVLMAMASALVPADLRTTGLALLMTLIGLSKMVSSLLFGFLWEVGSTTLAVSVFAIGMALVLPLSAYWMRGTHGE